MKWGNLCPKHIVGVTRGVCFMMWGILFPKHVMGVTRGYVL